MNYIIIKYENEEFWIEIDKENYAIRQIIISGDNIEISCINDCLAEGNAHIRSTCDSKPGKGSI